MLAQEARTGSLFGAHPGSVRVPDRVDLTQPELAVDPETETETERDR